MTEALWLQVYLITAWGGFMASSRLGCRLNKVPLTLTMTSSGTRPEGGRDKCKQPMLKPEPACYLTAADLRA